MFHVRFVTGNPAQSIHVLTFFHLTICADNPIFDIDGMTSAVLGETTDNPNGNDGRDGADGTHTCYIHTLYLKHLIYSITFSD